MFIPMPEYLKIEEELTVIQITLKILQFRYIGNEK